MTGSSRLKLGGALAAALIGVTAAVAPLSLGWVNEAREKRLQAEEQLASLQRVQGLLVDAEAGQRGYVITGQESFLYPYRVAASALIFVPRS
jgi:methyl-accepting chemotaxis protein